MVETTEDLLRLADDYATTLAEVCTKIAAWDSGESLPDAAQTVDVFSTRLVQLLVQAARADGSTWTEIGHAFGVTRQAAQQRFATTKQDHHTAAG